MNKWVIGLGVTTVIVAIAAIYFEYNKKSDVIVNVPATPQSFTYGQRDVMPVTNNVPIGHTVILMPINGTIVPNSPAYANAHPTRVVTEEEFRRLTGMSGSGSI